MDQDSVRSETTHRKRHRKHTVDGSWLSWRRQVQPFNRKILVRELGNSAIQGKLDSALEREPQPELQLPGSTEGVDACSHPDAVHVVACASGAINLSRASSQQSIERVPR